jgi:nicotinate-nucleotide adenylyltransferase
MSLHKPKRLPQRVGVFGGTFNPIHLGHRHVAMDVLAQFQLDCVYFVPCAQPPHKTNFQLAPAHDRLTMVRLALENSTNLQASAVEIERGGPSYSWETVMAFKDCLPPKGELFFLVGADAFLEIHTWKYFSRLFDHAALIVMTRPPELLMSAELTKRIEHYVQHNISKRYTLANDSQCLIHPQKRPIYLSTVRMIDVAATHLRHKVRNHQPIDQWVAPPVANYIQDKGLYQ